MRQTINREEIIKQLQFIELGINTVIDFMDTMDSYPIQVKKQYAENIANEEKKLNLLLANKTAYQKMLLKTINN